MKYRENFFDRQNQHKPGLNSAFDHEEAVYCFTKERTFFTMKHLRNYMKFDVVSFFADKTLEVISKGPLTEYGSGAVIGTKVVLAITYDGTEYPPSKDGSVASNRYEKFNVKILFPDTVDVQIGDVVTLVDATATVFGEYNNSLSVVARGLTKVSKGKEN